MFCAVQNFERCTHLVTDFQTTDLSVYVEQIKNPE